MPRSRTKKCWHDFVPHVTRFVRESRNCVRSCNARSALVCDLLGLLGGRQLIGQCLELRQQWPQTLFEKISNGVDRDLRAAFDLHVDACTTLFLAKGGHAQRLWNEPHTES